MCRMKGRAEKWNHLPDRAFVTQYESFLIKSVTIVSYKESAKMFLNVVLFSWTGFPFMLLEAAALVVISSKWHSWMPQCWRGGIDNLRVSSIKKLTAACAGAVGSPVIILATVVKRFIATELPSL